MNVSAVSLERMQVVGSAELRLGAAYVPSFAEYNLRAFAGAFETGTTGIIRARTLSGTQIGSDLTATGEVAAISIAFDNTTSQWIEFFGAASSIDGTLSCPSLALDGIGARIMTVTSVAMERTSVVGTIELRLGAIYLPDGTYNFRTFAGATESGITGTIRMRTTAGVQIGSDLTATGEIAARSISVTNSTSQWVEIFGLTSSIDGTLLCAAITFEFLYGTSTASAKDQILNDILTSLQAITTANGYGTNVVSTSVERVIRVWGETMTFPWLGYADVSSNYKHDPGTNIQGTMVVTVVGHVAATTSAACTTLITALENDLIAAMCSTATQRRGSDANGPNAIGTKVLRSANDIGEPHGIDSSGGYGTLTMDFEIKFMRTTGLS